MENSGVEESDSDEVSKLDPDKKPTLLIVDDEPANLQVLSVVLMPLYRVLVANSGKQAVDVAGRDKQPPDIILLDIMMPEMDGYQTLALLKKNPKTASIPVIFVTALSDELDEKRGLDLGASDYITKPIKPSVVRARVKTQLELKAAKENLEAKVVERTRDLQKSNALLKKTFMEVVRSFSLLIEHKDEFLAGHSRRVAENARKLARKLDLPQKEIDDIFLAGLLSRIGTITMPEELLDKPYIHLDKDQRRELVDNVIAAKLLFMNISLLRRAGQIIEQQFEQFDGGGMPYRLAGEKILLGSRILAVVRDFDLLLEGKYTSQAFSMDGALTFLENKSGAHYDPKILALFKSSFGEVSETYKDAVVPVGLTDLVPGMELVEVRFGKQLYVRDRVASEELIDDLREIHHQSEKTVHILAKVRKE